MILQAHLNIEKHLEAIDKEILSLHASKLPNKMEFHLTKRFGELLNLITYALIELEAITTEDTQEHIIEMNTKAKQTIGTLRKLKKEDEPTNEELLKLVKSFSSVLKRHLARLEKKEWNIRDFALAERLPSIHPSVISEIASHIHAKNDLYVLENHSGNGKRLLAFAEKAQAPNVYTYGIEEDTDVAQASRDDGVYKVAKGGIQKMTPNSFDVFLFLQESFTFGKSTYMQTDEVFQFGKFFMMRKPIKKGGYILFNLPYYRIPDFLKKIMNFHIDGMYRLDDETGNLLFVCSYKKTDDALQRKQLKTALLMPQRLPHYSEFEPIHLDTKDIDHPDDIQFQGHVIDVADHDMAFAEDDHPMDFIEHLFEPDEVEIEIADPLQEYKTGHLSAIAPTGITNGIYDPSVNQDLVDDEELPPHLLMTKIMRRDALTISEGTRVDATGKKVVYPIVSLKKSSELTMTTRTADGKTVSLLSQLKKEKDEEAAKKPKRTRRRSVTKSH